MSAFPSAICVQRVSKLTGPVSPLMRLIVEALCTSGFPPNEIAAFVYELLHGSDEGDGGRSNELLLAIVGALSQANKVELAKALGDLRAHQNQQKLWAELTKWIEENYPNIAAQLLAALRNKQPPFTNLDDAKVWARDWITRNSIRPGHS